MKTHFTLRTTNCSKQCGTKVYDSDRVESLEFKVLVLNTVTLQHTKDRDRVHRAYSMLFEQPKMDINVGCKQAKQNRTKKALTVTHPSATRIRLFKARSVIAKQCGTEVYDPDRVESLDLYAVGSDEFKVLVLNTVTLQHTKDRDRVHRAYSMLFDQPEMDIPKADKRRKAS